MTPRRDSAAVPWLLAAPAVVLLLMLFAGPLLLLLRVSLFESSGGTGFYRPGTWSVRAYSELLGERFGRGIVTFTVGLGVAVAALSVLIGYPLALFIHSLPRRAKVAALGAVVLPKLANVFVVLYGVNLLLGHFGPVNRVLLALGLTAEPLLLTHNLFGVVVAETYLILLSLPKMPFRQRMLFACVRSAARNADGIDGGQATVRASGDFGAPVAVEGADVRAEAVFGADRLRNDSAGNASDSK